MKPAAIGLRARTGRAIAVVLTADSDFPAFLWRGELSLVDPEVPATAEPFHEVMELPWKEATVAVQGLVTMIEAQSAIVIRRVVEEMRSRNFRIRTAGIVGSPDRSLERIGNEHIRAHAAEGVLFRQVLERGSKANGLPYQAFSDREIQQKVPAEVTAAVKQMGREAGPPWRADERLAATAAWLALSR